MTIVVDPAGSRGDPGGASRLSALPLRVGRERCSYGSRPLQSGSQWIGAE
ncbi:hypothetical protein A2U01_0114640, partial [Trifolium medium]|nr:hypothetical protein [Trifolium medium]